MLESYEQEIIRKRRSAKIFWFLVFSFATFLYFFFQGYYPSLDLKWKGIFESGGVREFDRDELIRSFGVVNVRVEPRDARILLSREAYSYDEKRMVPYGRYRLSVGKPGYIQNRVTFEIDREKPFYISQIQLIPRARYEKLSESINSISKAGEDIWIAKRGQRSIIYDETFLPIGSQDSYGTHIGEGYYQSGSSIARYTEGGWRDISWPGSRSLLTSCTSSLEVREGYLWCRDTLEALDPRGQSYSGILDIGYGYLRQTSTLITREGSLPLSTLEQSSPLWIEREGIWYVPSGGVLVPIPRKAGASYPLITTPLDSIDHALWADDTLVIFGKKGAESAIVLIDDRTPPRLIAFPAISLDELRLTKYQGNIFFKTKNALLFLYAGNDSIEWLIEGEIIAHSRVGALYRKDGELWRASWGEK